MIDKIKEQLKGTLKPSRYQHTINVADEAIKLGEKYSYNTEDCYIAGLLHDIAKVKDLETLKQICDKAGYDMEIKELESLILNPNSHSVLGAYIAEKTFGIKDEKILNAIRFHTTGRVNMGLLEKIVFLADYIEVGRDFEGLEEVRRLAYIDIDKAILAALNNNIVHVVKSGKVLLEDTVKARNFLIEEKFRGKI